MATNKISNLSNLVRLGWTDPRGNPLDWRYWQRQKRATYWKWVEMDEEEYLACQTCK